MDAVRVGAGGTARAMLDLCGATAAGGRHEVVLLTRDRTDVPASWGAGAGVPGCETLDPARGAMGRLSGRAVAQARGVLSGADILHLHGVWELCTLQMAGVARRLGRPCIVSLHGMLDDWCMARGGLKKRAYLALAGRRMLESTAAVHCTAQAELDQSRKWFPRGRGEVVPLILDLAPFRTLPGPAAARARFPVLTQGRPNVLFLSRVDVKKGVEALLHAAAVLQASQDVNVLIAGPGEPAYVEGLKGLARTLGLEDRVSFLGLVTGADKVSLYQAADLFVLPTRQENFGFVYYECLAAGTPLITTRGADTWPELEQGGGAAIVDLPEEAAAAGAVLAPQISGLLSDPARRADMGRKGREWVLRTLDPAAVLGRFEAMYARAVAGVPPPVGRQSHGR